MKKVTNIIVSVIMIVSAIVIIFFGNKFYNTIENNKAKPWFQTGNQSENFQKFVIALYNNYYIYEDSTIVFDIHYENTDIYMIKPGEDDNDNSKISVIDGFDIEEEIYNLDRSFQRRFANILLKKNEVIFYNSYTGNQLIYSFDGENPDNLFQTKKLRFSKYNDNWYSYFEPYNSQREWRKINIFNLFVLIMAIILCIVITIIQLVTSKKKKTNKKFSLILALPILSILFIVQSMYFISHNTYYKYNNLCIYGKDISEVEEKYGELSFVSTKSDNSGYAGYSIDRVGDMYLMYFDSKGTIYKITTGVGPGG